MQIFGRDRAMEAYEEDKMQQEEQAAEEAAGQQEEKAVPIRKKARQPWATWEVDGKEYHLKLRTPDVQQLESKYKTNLMNIMGSDNSGMPALTVMLDVTHAAMRGFHHGINAADVTALFDKYLDEGGSQLEFYTSVYMNIFAVSGFFSTAVTEQMQEALDQTKNIM